jgi:hypothetical protein
MSGLTASKERINEGVEKQPKGEFHHIVKETHVKETHVPSGQTAAATHVRVEPREAILIKDGKNVGEQVKQAATTVKDGMMRNPWLVVTGLIVLVALWNWNAFHRKPETITDKVSVKLTGNDFDTNWGALNSKMQTTRKGMEDSLTTARENMQKWWVSWEDSAKSWKDELAQKTAKAGTMLKESLPESLQGGHTTDFETMNAKMQQTKKGMEDSLKTTHESMQKWWDSWEDSAKSWKEELAQKTAKAGSILKEALPESLQGGTTDHLHKYDPNDKSRTDTIKIHHHGYEQPAAEKAAEKKKGLFS